MCFQLEFGAYIASDLFENLNLSEGKEFSILLQGSFQLQRSSILGFQRCRVALNCDESDNELLSPRMWMVKAKSPDMLVAQQNYASILVPQTVSVCVQCGRPGSILRWENPWEGNGNPLSNVA